METQNSLPYMTSHASIGSPRTPQCRAMPCQLDQAPSWVPRTRRGNTRKTYQHWIMHHKSTQTDGGLLAAIEWEAFSQALTLGNVLQFPR